MLGLKHLVRYLSKTRRATLLFPVSGASVLIGSSDSSWGNTNTPHGTSGNVFLVGGTPIAWWSKKQSSVAQSTCEAEYEALRHFVVAARWIKPLFEEIFSVESAPIVTQLDNTAALLTATTDKVNARNRHFLMRLETVREAVKSGVFKPVYTPSDDVIADGLTKSLSFSKHAAFAKLLSLDLGVRI